MKNTILAIMFLAAGLMITACNNTSKDNSKAVESDNTEIVATDTPTEEVVLKEEIDELDAIRLIRNEWTGKPITIEGDKEKAGIEQLALAFCRTYPDFVVNKMMGDYLVAPQDYKNELYSVENQSDNGFIRCVMTVETIHETNACYWNRKNGHKLFAAYMQASYENSGPEDLLVFYDYDPATGVMTPEPTLTESIEKQGKDHDYYEVRLPQEGKDIILYVCTENKELDNYDCDEQKVKWNGMTFDFK